MTTYIKRIQSRLSRRGVKVSQTEIRELYQKVVTDLENPTEEELTQVVASFLSSLATTNHETEITKNTQLKAEEIELESIQSQPKEKPEINNQQNPIQPGNEPQAVSANRQTDSDSMTISNNNCTPTTTPPAEGTAEKEDYLALLDESQKNTTISQSQKGEIVQKAFSQLGFTATESEVLSIVKAFETTQTAEEEFFDLVLPLVKDWIKKKTEERVHKYESAYQEIAGDVCESLQEIVDAKDKFETNLFTFRQTLGEVSDNFRSCSQKSIRNLQDFFAAR